VSFTGAKVCVFLILCKFLRIFLSHFFNFLFYEPLWGFEITIDGTAYPCSPTMGAMVRFEKETGRDVSSMNAGSFTDLCTYLWCCVVSACDRDRVKFKMSLLDFCDRLSPDELAGWSEAVNSRMSDGDGSEGDGDGEKKVRRHLLNDGDGRRVHRHVNGRVHGNGARRVRPCLSGMAKDAQ